MKRSLVLSCLAMLSLPMGTVLAAVPAGPQILLDDVTRFYALYDATGGKPDVERIERDYLDKASPSLREFMQARRVTAQRIFDQMAADPSMYAHGRECLAVLPAVKQRLTAAFARLAALYPSAKFPPVAIVVGRGRPVGITNPSGVTIGLEALCAADFMNPDVEDRFVYVIAHEYAHIQQGAETDIEPGDPRATVLRMSLMEGAAEFVAELTAGGVGNGRHAGWTKGREAEIENAFVRDLDSTDLSAWMYNYQAGSDQPYDLGYWVGYRIAKAYYLHHPDHAAALQAILHVDDPHAFLKDSGWTPGMVMPAGSGQRPLALQGLALGRVALGNPPPEVRARMGAPSRTSGPEGVHDAHWYYPGLEVLFGGGAEEITSTSPAYCTPAGVCPGMPEAALVAAYGPGVAQQRKDGRFIVYSAIGDVCGLEAAIVAGRVKLIRVNCQP